MLTIYGYKKCSTVKKALKFLDENNVKYIHIDNVENKLTQKLLKEIHQKSELPIKRLFNTSGNLYKELKLKDTVDSLTNSEAYKLLATDGMLVKRPIFLNDKVALVGFKEQEWINNI